MKIMVTGGSGFIGRSVMEAGVSAGHSMKSFDRANGHDVLGDLTDFAWADTIIHLAGVLGTAELFDTPEDAVVNNVIGSLRVLQACEKYDAGYVGIQMPAVFDSIYTATKVCAGRLATAWHKYRGVPVSHVRAFNAYGPGQAHGEGHPQKILPTFATEAWNNRPIPIWGDGEQTVDLIHADDLGRMLIDATNHGDDATFDGGTGIPFTVNEVAHLVLNYTGSKAGIEYLPMRDGEDPTHIVATGEGWERLTWKPQHTELLFAEAVEWYQV